MAGWYTVEQIPRPTFTAIPKSCHQFPATWGGSSLLDPQSRLSSQLYRSNPHDQPWHGKRILGVNPQSLQPGDLLLCVRVIVSFCLLTVKGDVVEREFAVASCWGDFSETARESRDGSDQFRAEPEALDQT